MLNGSYSRSNSIGVSRYSLWVGKKCTGFCFIWICLIYIFSLFIRDFAPWQRPSQLSKTLHHPLEGLKEVLSNPQSWMLAIYGFSSWAPMVVFAALWGVSFMKEGYNLTTQQSSVAMAWVWIGLAVTSPLLVGYLNVLKGAVLF